MDVDQEHSENLAKRKNQVNPNTVVCQRDISYHTFLSWFHMSNQDSRPASFSQLLVKPVGMVAFPRFLHMNKERLGRRLGPSLSPTPSSAQVGPGRNAKDRSSVPRLSAPSADSRLGA